MSNIVLDPYLFFNGNCKEAMEFYEGIFGGELTMQTYSKVPGEMPGKKEHPDWVMHSMIDGEIRLMASDSEKASPATRKVELSLSGSDEEKLRNMFNALSEGGTVKFPLKEEFWGDIFGGLTDKFGVDWMVNITAKK